jgi:ubiquinone/menaquinone biosynthesis C-methylase UbiE
VARDLYARSSERWAAGASLVYRPIARHLISRWPGSLDGRTVLDAGAGTGVASEALLAQGAQPLAADFSFSMLSWEARLRPPSAVADIAALPFLTQSVDGAVAAFVLNHLRRPEAGLAELGRVTRPGGIVLACVYSSRSRSPVRDRLDELATARGWRAPAWYVDMKTEVVPLLGGSNEMARAARAAGLDAVEVDETPVDVGVTVAEQLVDYRFGQAQFAEWLDGLGPARVATLKAEIADGIRSVMEPYRPIVVFLAARVP